MSVTLLSSEQSHTDDGTVGDRLRRTADLAIAQTRVTEQRLEARQVRRRASVLLGTAAGVAGIAGSILMAYESGTSSSLWWVAIPTWILAATPIVTLMQDRADALPALRGRAGATASLAQELCRICETEPHSLADRPFLLEGLRPLIELVEQDVKTTSQTLHACAEAGKVRRRHRRIVPRDRRVLITTTDGRRLRGTIADVSPSGVALTECLPRLFVGDRVLIGQTWAKVARCWDKGRRLSVRDRAGCVHLR